MGKKTNAKLGPGEVACYKCEGTGKSESWEVGQFKITPECTHCLGEGKFDWIERVMGKTPRVYREFDLTGQIAKELSVEIDKEILESVVDACKVKKEQNTKEKEEDQYDNGVFSELLFHPIIKQKFEGEED